MVTIYGITQFTRASRANVVRRRRGAIKLLSCLSASPSTAVRGMELWGAKYKLLHCHRQGKSSLCTIMALFYSKVNLTIDVKAWVTSYLDITTYELPPEQKSLCCRSSGTSRQTAKTQERIQMSQVVVGADIVAS